MKILSLLRGLFTGNISGEVQGRFVGRAPARDVAFAYRMGAGFAGDVNRTHPASIEPALIDASNPPTFYGEAVVVNTGTNSVRKMADDYDVDYVYGVTVRPYPFQQQSGGMSADFGAATPPTSGIIDVLRAGYIMVSVVGQPTKGGPVYVWTSASTGSHVKGGFEAVDPTVDGIQLGENYKFNGPADANGITELEFNV